MDNIIYLIQNCRCTDNQESDTNSTCFKQTTNAWSTGPRAPLAYASYLQFCDQLLTLVDPGDSIVD